MGKENRTVKFQQEVLTSKQQRVLSMVAPVVDVMGFYLGGGTALALHLGHRRSDDFDWFTKRMTLEPLHVTKKIQEQDIPFKVESIASGTLHGKINGVNISLLEFNYPTLQRSIAWKEMHCKIASLQDLSCMKLSAITQRGSRKDFIDMFALLKEVFTLEQMLTFYQKKFDVHEIAYVLYALSYFDDAEKEPMPEMVWSVSWKKMKKEIQNSIKSNKLI